MHQPIWLNSKSPVTLHQNLLRPWASPACSNSSRSNGTHRCLKCTNWSRICNKLERNCLMLFTSTMQLANASLASKLRKTHFRRNWTRIDLKSMKWSKHSSSKLNKWLPFLRALLKLKRASRHRSPLSSVHSLFKAWMFFLTSWSNNASNWSPLPTTPSEKTLLTSERLLMALLESQVKALSTP